MKAETERRLRSFEMWCYRRMLQLSWTLKVNLRWFWKGERRKKTAEQRQEKESKFMWTYFEAEWYCEGCFVGKGRRKGSRRMQRRTWIMDIKDWSGQWVNELVQRSKDRAAWRGLVHGLQTEDVT